MNAVVLHTRLFLLTTILASLLLAYTVSAQEEMPLEAEASTEISQERTQARADFEARREAAQAEIEAQRDQAATARAEAQANREDGQASSSEFRAEQQSAVAERSKERITNLAANVSNRMDTAAARIQNIIDRLDSRMTKLAEAGLDTADAELALASAQTSLDAAVQDLATIDVTVATAVSAEDPRTAWQGVKLLYTDIRTQLKTAHTEVKASVQALKDAARALDISRGSAAAVQNEASITSETEAEASVE